MIPKYLPSINVLRGLASLMVCLFHFITYRDFRSDLFDDEGLVSQFGNPLSTGVFVFFVVSGFVIPYSLWKSDFRLKHFFRFIFRRSVRIEIPYLSSIVLYLLVALGFSMYLNQSFSLEIPRLLAHVVYIIPFTEHHWYNEVYWTLAIEFQYYVLMGLLVLSLFSERSFWMHFGLIAFALSGILIGDNRLVFYYAPVFLLGIITFLHFIHRLSLPVFLTYAMIFFLMMFFMHSLLIALFSAFTVVGIFFIKKENVILKQLGDISYSLYLVHGLSGMQLLYFLAPHADNLFLRMVSVFAALFFSLLAAWIFHRCVEWPAKQWASRFK